MIRIFTLEINVPASLNIAVTISKLCPRSQQSFLSSIPISIDGAVVESHNERDVECVITFATESILERFMLRFERLQIDCNDMLYIYDGAHAIGAHKVCSDTAQAHRVTRVLTDLRASLKSGEFLP